MKKVLLILIVCILACGCTKNNKKTGGWETIISNRVNDISEEDLNNFNKAIKSYKDNKLEAVVLLGKQVVAGTNYMFLAKSTQNSYKVVIVYTDLEGISKVSSVIDFDYSLYTGKNIDGETELLSGGWYTESTSNTYKLEDEKIESLFEDATSTLAGMSYKPLIVIGKQIVSGTNYAILCYGSATVPDAQEGIYLLTINASLDGKSELVNIAYVDLASYN